MTINFIVVELVSTSPFKCVRRDHGADVEAFAKDARETGERGVLRDAQAITPRGAYSLGCCNYHRDDQPCTKGCSDVREHARELFGV